MKYETEIDGVRALAVIGVLLFHLGVPFIAGGFIGVDVFFVLSGYLITALVTRNMGNGTFSFKDFYLRRARRLLPALFAVVSVCFVLSFLLLSPDDFKSFCRSAWHSVLSISNINFWLESGYFDSDKFTKPLLHTWSLGVEEQFYLLWPLILAGLTWFKTGLMKRIALGVFVLAGFAISLIMMNHAPSAVFYLSPYRAWQFAAGGLLALLLHDHEGEGRAWALPTPLAVIATLGGLALVSYGFVAVSPKNFPGTAALIPTIGTLLIILGGSTPVSRVILANPLSRLLGRLSYSIYLTHWPIIVFWRYYNNRPLNIVEMVIVGALSIGTAYLLYRTVETKFRRPWTKDPATEKFAVPAGILASAMGIMLFCIYPWVQNGWTWRVSKESQDLILATAKGDKIKCKMRPILDLDKQCFIGAQKRNAEFVIIGDSHAAALTRGLGPLAAGAKKTGISMTKPGTLPFFDGRTYDNDTLSERNFDAEFKWIMRPKVEAVILHGRYAQNWVTKNPSVQDQKTTKYVGMSGKVAPTNTAESQNYFKKNLGKTLQKLKKSGKTVVLVGAIPYQGVNLAQCINRPGWLMTLDHSIKTCSGFSKEDSLNRMAEVNAVLAAAAKRADVIWVDPTPTFCPESEVNCLRIKDGNLLYKDDDHLNSFGARILTELIFEKLGWAIETTNDE